MPTYPQADVCERTLQGIVEGAGTLPARRGQRRCGAAVGDVVCRQQRLHTELEDGSTRKQVLQASFLWSKQSKPKSQTLQPCCLRRACACRSSAASLVVSASRDAMCSRRASACWARAELQSPVNTDWTTLRRNCAM